MGRTKAQIKKIAETFIEQKLDEAACIEKMQKDEFSEKEIQDVIDAMTPEADVKQKEKIVGKTLHTTYNEIQLYRKDGKLTDGQIIKTVSIEPDRAERLNSQSENSLIRYEEVK